MLLVADLLLVCIAAYALSVGAAPAASSATSSAAPAGGGTAFRLTAAGLWAPALILWAVQLCGVAGRFTLLPAAGVSLALVGAALLLASRRLSWTEFVRCLRHDASLFTRLWRDVRTAPEPTLLLVPVALAALALGATLAWVFRSWSWDSVWYHVPIVRFTLQRHSTRWVESHIPWISSYPRNVEWLDAWACLLRGDARLEDAAQLPLVGLGVVTLIAWSLRSGVRPALAVGVAVALVLLPPVFLQLPTTYVDVAAASFFAAALFFTSDADFPRTRSLAALAMGLYAGTKFSGVFHLVLWLPWWGFRAALELKRSARRARTLLSMAGSAVLCASVGAYTYVQNGVRTGNPVWPFRVDLPGLHLPGTMDPSDILEQPRGVPLYFLRSPGEPLRTLRSWYETTGDYWPDLRTGGFGPLFRWLLLPALALLLIVSVWQRVRQRAPAQETLAVLAFFAFSVSVPASWWPRYILGAAMASLVAFALLLSRVPWRPLRLLASSAFVILAALGFVETLQRMNGPFPARFAEALRSTPREREVLQLARWMWPRTAAEARDRELGPADVIAYDQSASFLAEFFRPDARGSVQFISSSGTPVDYLLRVRASGARWVGVEGGSRAERALVASGAERLFVAPGSETVVYRMRGPMPHE